MFLRLSFLFAMVLCLFTSSAFAQEVTVECVSLDRDSALREAERLAVEQVVGTYIDSTTLVENNVVELDEIYAKAEGYTRVVKILSEGQTAEGYRVMAVIDVDTSPNTELMSRIQMLSRLNDPRIAVIVLKEGQYNVHEKRAESIIMERLVDLGLSHVVDANIVAGLHDARMLESLYRGEPIGNIGKSFGVDFVVIGSSRISSGTGKVPDFKGGYKTVALCSGNMELLMKIIKMSTGEIIDSFSVDGKGLGINLEIAERETVKNAAGMAARKVEERLKSFSMKVDKSVQIIAISNDYGKVSDLVQMLKSIPGVQNVFLREHNGSRAIIDIETNQKPSTIVSMLQKRNSSGLFVEGLTDSRVELVLS